MYDENGEAFGFNYNGNDYYYVRNAQNDVVRIVDSANETVVSYQYDSWGKLLSCEDTSENDIVSFINPYTYRGYYYDSDTQLYYLSSRYYNPELCRFISADSVVSGTGGEILGYNMFAYCMNNPVNTSDSDGNWPKWAKTVAKVAGAVVAVVAVTAIVAVTAGVAAAAIGATAAMVNSIMVGATVGGLVSGSVNIAVQCKTKGAKKIKIKDTVKSTTYGSVAGAITGASSACVPHCTSATQVLLQKGFQIAVNTLVSDSAYLLQSISEGGPNLSGLATSTLSGVISGATFNAPAVRALAISIGLEFAGYTEDLIDVFIS